MKITLEQAKDKVWNAIINAEIDFLNTCCIPSTAVSTISEITSSTGLTKYGARKAIKELIKDGMIYYTSQGCPAIESCGEYRELVCEARPPINGYALTAHAFRSSAWHEAYDDWCKSMEEWANGI